MDVAAHHTVSHEYDSSACAHGPYGPFSHGSTAKRPSNDEYGEDNYWRKCNKGWVVGYTVGLNGMPRGLDFSLTTTVEETEVLAPNLVVSAGARIKGLIVYDQLGFKNLGVNRCTYTRDGSTCALDFHTLADGTTLLPFQDGIVLGKVLSLDTSKQLTAKHYKLVQPPEPDKLKKRRQSKTKGSTAQRTPNAKPSKTAPTKGQSSKQSLGTSTLKMRGPAGMESISMYDGTDVQRIGALRDDSVYKLGLPVVRNVNPQFTENILYFKVRQHKPPFMLFSHIGPRCLLPVGGDYCKEVSQRPKYSFNRRLAEEGRAHAVSPYRRSLQAGEAPHVEHLALPAELVHAGRTEGSLPAVTIVTEDGRELRVRMAHVMEPGLLGAADALTKPSVHLTESRELQVGQPGGVTSLTPEAPKVGALDPKFDAGIQETSVLMEGSFLFFHLKHPIPVPIVPLFLIVDAGVEVKVDLVISLLLQEKLLAASLVPIVTPFFSAAIQIDVGLGYAGVRAVVRLFSLGIIPTASFGITPGGAVRLCLSMDLAIIYPSITIEAYFAFRLCIKCTCCPIRIKIGFATIKLPKCSLVMCAEKTFEIASYKPYGDAWHTTELFKICNLPPDTTPPEIDGAYASALQVDATTVVTEFGGFYDDENYVRQFSVALGKTPMMQDIAEYFDDEDITTFTFNGVDCPGEDAPAFVSVVAANVEGLASGISVPFVCDASAPQVLDIQVKNAATGQYLNYGDFQVINATDVLSIRFKVVEPAEHAEISQVRFSIGTQEGVDDVLPWADTGSQDLMASKSTDWYFAEAGGLDLQHGVYYWVNVESTNSLGLQAVFTSHALFVDHTPALPRIISESGGTLGWGEREDVTFWPSRQRIAVTFQSFVDREGSEVTDYWVNLEEVEPARMM
ncbi:rad50, partial [Symbiodinium sp. KB8]